MTCVRRGCWMNCVNTTGWPVAVPSNSGKIGITIGNRLTSPWTRFDMVGASDRRTKRRSAEITAWMVSDTPKGNNVRLRDVA